MQTIVVWIIVALAAVYLVRKYTRALSGKDRGCDCGTSSCGACTDPKDRLCDFPRPENKENEK